MHSYFRCGIKKVFYKSCNVTQVHALQMKTYYQYQDLLKRLIWWQICDNFLNSFIKIYVVGIAHHRFLLRSKKNYSRIFIKYSSLRSPLTNWMAFQWNGLKDSVWLGLAQWKFTWLNCSLQWLKYSLQWFSYSLQCLDHLRCKFRQLFIALNITQLWVY